MLNMTEAKRFEIDHQTAFRERRLDDEEKSSDFTCTQLGIWSNDGELVASYINTAISAPLCVGHQSVSISITNSCKNVNKNVTENMTVQVFEIFLDLVYPITVR
jgi:hypothetical protein